MKFIQSKKIILLVVLLFMTIFLYFANNSFLNKNKTKILLIGVDGADWKVMNPLINQGKLPNIKRLMDKGSWGDLESVPPLISEAIWTTICTGKKREEHGILDRLMEDPATGELVPPTSNLRTAKAIWNILSEQKKKVGVIGYRMTWPPEEINGVMISDRADTDMYLSKDYSYPSFIDLCSESEYKGFCKIKYDTSTHIEWEDDFFSNFSKYLLQKQGFDFFCLYIIGVDAASHHFWKYLFPEGFIVDKEDREKYKDIIKDYYIWCDGTIADLLKEVDEDTTVIIVSDHGFTSDPKGDYYDFSKLDFLLELSGLSKMTKNSKSVFIQEDLSEKTLNRQRHLSIHGDLNAEEFQEVKKEAKEVLKNIKDKKTNFCIFNIVADTREGFIIEIDYSYIDHHFDNYILIRDKEYQILDFLSKTPYSGSHYRFGVIIISGKNIQPNKTIKTAAIYDITPTILYLIGLPIAKDMKGKVLVEAIEDNYLRRHPIRFIETYETDRIEKPPKLIRSPQDEEKIKERMRSLGYIN